jgi:hypothetical protein
LPGTPTRSSLAVSLGQVKTLIECPFSMTHSAVPYDVPAARHLSRRHSPEHGLKTGRTSGDLMDALGAIDERLRGRRQAVSGDQDVPGQNRSGTARSFGEDAGTVIDLDSGMGTGSVEPIHLALCLWKMPAAELYNVSSVSNR